MNNTQNAKEKQFDRWFRSVFVIIVCVDFAYFAHYGFASLLREEGPDAAPMALLSAVMMGILGLTASAVVVCFIGAALLFILEE